MTKKLKDMSDRERWHLFPIILSEYKPDNPAPHMMFIKGYTPRGFKGQAFHVHIRYPNDWDEVIFRDYLVTHPEVALVYGKLKIKLKNQFEPDRDAYTNGKTDFVKNVCKFARK